MATKKKASKRKKAMKKKAAKRKPAKRKPAKRKPAKKKAAKRKPAKKKAAKKKAAKKKARKKKAPALSPAKLSQALALRGLVARHPTDKNAPPDYGGRVTVTKGGGRLARRVLTNVTVAEAYKWLASTKAIAAKLKKVQAEEMREAKRAAAPAWLKEMKRGARVRDTHGKLHIYDGYADGEVRIKETGADPLIYKITPRAFQKYFKVVATRDPAKSNGTKSAALAARERAALAPFRKR